MSFIEVERRGDVVWLTLNRPERLNAVHLAMRDELWTMLEYLHVDSTVRVAVLRGAWDREQNQFPDLSMSQRTFDAQDCRFRALHVHCR